MRYFPQAFDVFCNKGVSGSSSAELLASFCDNILKKGCNERLSDQEIENALEKDLLHHLVMPLLHWIRRQGSAPGLCCCYSTADMPGMVKAIKVHELGMSETTRWEVEVPEAMPSKVAASSSKIRVFPHEELLLLEQNLGLPRA